MIYEHYVPIVDILVWHSSSNEGSERHTRRVEVRDGAIESETSEVYNSHSSSTPTAGSVKSDDLQPEIAD